MRRRGQAAALAALWVGAIGLPAFADEPASIRQAELLHRLRHDCGSCHGMTMKGGLGPPLLPATLAGKSDTVLADVIRDGLPGTPMPPWGGEITRGEALWLARLLKDGIDATAR